VELAVTFPGTYNWTNRSDRVSVDFTGDLSQLIYNPPLVETLAVRVNRSDYVTEEILNLHVPLSNGLMFVPSARDASTGLAIIHNTSQYHTAPRWTLGALHYMTGPKVLPAPYQFFMVNDVSVAQATILANQLNNQVTWVISPEVTGMQGFEYLRAYFESDRGDQWSHDEWW
jgi:hypothetical protein